MSRKWSGESRAIGLAALTCWVLFGVTASAGNAPSSHGPIGVMGDHTHKKGEVMFSYRYMRMGMDGLRDNDDGISRSQVLQDFLVTPINMDMEMHMFGAMYAPIDRLTIMLMVPYLVNDMEHRNRAGVGFTTKSEGIGDVRATALVELWETEGHKIHANIGLSFPTGSIREKDRLPAPGGGSVRARLPYPMQLGSGTFDFLPGLTYTGHQNKISWGAQARGEIRLEENDEGYTKGNEYALTGWGAYEFNDWVSASLRLEWLQELNYRGRDPLLNPAVVPTADPGRRAIMRLDALAGVNFAVPTGALQGIRFAIEAGLPAYQRLDGPALETDWMVTVGVQYALP
jgi:hypothetical protein